MRVSWERLGGFSSNLELEVPRPEGIHTENFVCFCSGSAELQMHENGVFFTPVKYTFVCCAPQVSWAARHTTACLDLKSLGNNEGLSLRYMYLTFKTAMLLALTRPSRSVETWMYSGGPISPTG